ncbi:XRE family transcriptional regulator [Streptomyces celluloflavus]|uniref:XRE family transcriptional regulator n=1 Tax=Streptomyces celluloflavus TaxID=58344 RepID=UPI00364DDD40
MTGNFGLKAKMDEAGFTQRELVDAVNGKLREAGEHPTVGDRTVRTWLTGKSCWPHPAKRRALEAVFGCTAEELGFIRPIAERTEEDVHRRKFCGAVTGAAVAVPLPAARRAVGSSDVLRARKGLENLTSLDQARGGHAALEKVALAGARDTLELQQRAATQRIRQRLFSVAADYTAAAAWSCVDAWQLDRAQQHLNEALRLAGMAQDITAQMRVWNATALLAHQRREYGEAVAAAQAAQATSITRRDPFFGSLAHARAAVGHANCDDRQSALRSLGHAEDALAKADERPRPGWVAFYGPAELHALAAILHDRVGSPAEAEAASYRALSALPEKYRRNRAMTIVRLALAQLHQGDIDRGCATTADAFALMVGHPLPGRLRVVLGDFHRDLLTLAPTAAVTREWGDRYRSEWSPA